MQCFYYGHRSRPNQSRKKGEHKKYSDAKENKAKNAKRTQTCLEGENTSCKTNITGNNKLEKSNRIKKNEILINAIMRAKELNFVYLAKE